jgi:hypothetical protein
VTAERLRRASITKSDDKPSQCCGSPYLPLIGFYTGRPFHFSIGQRSRIIRMLDDRIAGRRYTKIAYGYFPESII